MEAMFLTADRMRRWNLSWKYPKEGYVCNLCTFFIHPYFFRLSSKLTVSDVMHYDGRSDRVIKNGPTVTVHGDLRLYLPPTA